MVETIESLDFELEIGQDHGLKYPVTVLESPAGRASGILHFPFRAQLLERHLEELRIALRHSAGSRREEPSQQERVARDFGRRLFDALFADEVGILYDSSRHQAAAEGKILRLKLRIEPPELAFLPWEFLYDSHLGEYVCLSHATPLARYVEHPEPAQPPTVTPPLRILGIVAAPPGSARAAAAREKRLLEEATQHLQSLELVAVDWVEGGTWSDLLQALGSNDWHVVHYVGEGGVDDSGEGFVVLADGDDEGQAERLSATRLSRLLASRTSLQLVWLSAIQGAQGGGRDRFSGTASHLVQRGIPAVLTVQYGFSERVAETFLEAFYAALAASMPMDLAVTKGRMAVRSEVPSSLEWSLPVLHTHSPGHCPFERETLAVTARERGDEALAGDQFERAILQYTLAAEVGADADARERVDLAEEAHQVLRDAEDRLRMRTESAEARADALLQVVDEVKSLQQQLPDSQALHQLLSQAEEERAVLRDQLWQDGQQLMRRKAIGLTLAGQHRRMEESVRLLQKAASLDGEESAALKEDLAKATHRLGYLQNAQVQAKADRGRRLRIYGILAAAVIGVLVVVYVVLGLVPSPTPVAEATPDPTARPTHTAMQTATTAPSHTAMPTPTALPTAMATSVSSANPTLDITASPSPAPTDTPTPTSVPTQEPTVTPTWTATPTPVPTEPPPATPPPAAPISAPARGPTATPTAGIVYPAPALVQPEDVVFLSQGADSRYTMRWEWDGTLQADEWFDVRIWQAGMPHYGIAWTKEPQYVYDICLKRNGLYFWSVAIVRGEGSLWLADLSPEATPRRFSSSRSDEWCDVHGRWVQEIVE
jgi:hypothetical protein